MYFLRQIILDTKVNPKKIPKIPENMICLETPERSSETEKGGVLWITDQGPRAQELLRQGGVDTVLEWNTGNHFQENAARTAKGFLWCIKQVEEC